MDRQGILADSRNRLTEQDYWQSIYDSRKPTELSPPPEARKRSFAGRLVCRLAGVDSIDLAYADYHFWHVVLPKYLSPDKTARALEIGAAPATSLLKLNEIFGFQPFGVEYTAAGAAAARANLVAAGFSADQIYESDAFSDDFQRRHKGSFDVVMSLGFIEHFTDVESVIQHHVDLLAPGGTLIISIPRLLGINYPLARLIDPPSLPLHNLTIMRRKRYRELFSGLPLQELYCDYHGTLHVLVSDHPGDRKLSKLVLRLARMAHLALTVGMYRLLKDRAVESGICSPHLLYIGRKPA